jgi:ATP-dependent DNA helicase RecG
MRDMDILTQKGKSRATYYVPSHVFHNPETGNLDTNRTYSAPVPPLTTPVPPVSAPVPPVSAPVPPVSAPVPRENRSAKNALLHELPGDLQELVTHLGKRSNNRDEVEQVIYSLCSWKPLKLIELSQILDRSEKYVLREFITPMRETNKLAYTIPGMPNHPEQAYIAVK